MIKQAYDNFINFFLTLFNPQPTLHVVYFADSDRIIVTPYIIASIGRPGSIVYLGEL